VPVDPVTGTRSQRGTRTGFLILAVADPGGQPAGTATRYMVGLAAPRSSGTPPPVTARPRSACRSKQAGGLLHFNELTGGMETSNAELAARGQLDRAIIAAHEGR
jgi:hypothetical protein